MQHLKTFGFVVVEVEVVVVVEVDVVVVVVEMLCALATTIAVLPEVEPLEVAAVPDGDCIPTAAPVKIVAGSFDPDASDGFQKPL